MKNNPENHRRRSIRLKGYDYTRPGGYYVTLVTQNRECLFGDIKNGKMVLNVFGKIVDYYWQNIPRNFKHTRLGVFQIMPNHLHGIIIIKDFPRGAMHSRNEIVYFKNYSIRNASPQRTYSDDENLYLKNNSIKNTTPQRTRPHGTQPGSLGAILQNFQSVTTRKINHIRKTPGQRLWQRNYWEHIIRDEKDFDRIYEYIINNPLQWESDNENKGNL
ncbi:transposase [candidate division KSB1 bacterium]|nr:transposase [candidate division KSB1 bacterium]